MPILLSDQLKQIQQLNELQYHAPVFDKKYYDKSHGTQHSIGRMDGRRMFHDFYAMEFLWSFLGSGQIPKGEREKRLAMDPEDPNRDVVPNKSHKFLPDQAVKTIDSVYEQVTNAVAKNLLAYIRLAVVQEFQYLTVHADGWTHFRQSLISAYNAEGKISKKEYDALVKEYIPKMAKYPLTIRKLLKFSKYFSSTYTFKDSDAYDVSRRKEKQSTQTSEPTPETEPKTSEEPDTTDYEAEPTSREFGKYGGKDQPTSPYEPEIPWSGMSSFNDAGDLPKIPSEDDDADLEQPLNEQLLTEEDINTHKVKQVYHAMNKAGITLDDIEKAYNYIPWDGAYGGPRWGAGVIALLKLVHAKKNLSTEDMNHIIDHIYDLQHNTGSLLNKGPMYVSENDLNRRYKITDVMRFVPFVSPLIKDIILRYQKYLRNDPAQAEREAKMETLIQSPKLPLLPEEQNELQSMGFQKLDDNTYRVAMNFKNKQGKSVGGVYYEITKREVGTLVNGEFKKQENANPLYLVSDNLLADVKAFDTFPEAKAYLETYKHEMNDHGSVGTLSSAQASVPPAIKSEKQIYIDKHHKIKLSPEKEQQLLNINLGWRNKPSSQYYKAYFADGGRLHFYAFSDGSYLITFQNDILYKIFHEFQPAFQYAAMLTKTAQPYPEKEKMQAEINAALHKSASPSVFTLKYLISPDQFSKLESMMKTYSQSGNVKYDVLLHKNGLAVVYQSLLTTMSPAKPIPIFGVGKEIKDENTVVPHWKLIRLDPFTGDELHEWAFSTIEELFPYLLKLMSGNIPSSSGQKITTVTPSTYVSPSGKQLPPNATSKVAYSVHSGISIPPKSTIRLTKEDETKLVAIGFEPRIVGNDVWYIHKPSGDTVKFYPNNTAKLLFTSQSSSKLPTLNKDIEGMLTWLPTKYNNQTSKSPIVTKGGTQSIVNKGVKAGILFDKDIINAGFSWNESKSCYIGKDGDDLHIRPDRSSYLNVHNIEGVGDQSYEFKDLISLVKFLKEEYLQKKSNVKTASATKLPSVPGLTAEQLDLLEKAAFKYGGPVNNGGQLFTTYTGGHIFTTYTGGHIVVYPKGDVKVFDFVKNDWDLYAGESFTNYLKQKYGNSSSNYKPHSHPNIMSKEEEEEIIKLASKFGLKGVRKYEEPIQEVKQQMQYVELADDHGPVYAINKEGGAYKIWKINPNEPTNSGEWKLITGKSVFIQILFSLSYLLENYTGTSSSSSKEPFTLSSKDEGYAKLWEIGKAMDGIHINDGMFESTMQSLGFYFDYVDEMYINYNAKQIVVVTKDVSQKYKYTVLYLDNNNNPEYKEVNNENLFKEIGNSGNIASVNSSSNNIDLNPSGVNYKQTNDESNSKLIRLNSHDENIMNSCGFKFVPEENRYYKNSKGDIFKFYSTGMAEFNFVNGKFGSIGNIPDALKFAVNIFLSKKHRSTSISSLLKNINKFMVKYGFDYVDTYISTDDNKEVLVFDNYSTKQSVRVVIGGKIYLSIYGGGQQIFNSFEEFETYIKSTSLQENVYKNIMKFIYQ